MSHRRQTPEEHFAKAHRREFEREEMHRRFLETQARKAKQAVTASQIAAGLGFWNRIYTRLRKPKPKKEEVEIKVKE